MRVDRRAAEHLVHALDEALRHRVLEPIGLLVHFAPVEADDLDQEKLDQSVPAQDVQCQLPARRRELRSGVGLVSDETAVGQGLEHRRDRTRGHRGDRGQAPGSHRNPRLALLLEQHGLQVVLDGGGRHIRTLAWNARAPSA